MEEENKKKQEPAPDPQIGKMERYKNKLEDKKSFWKAATIACAITCAGAIAALTLMPATLPIMYGIIAGGVGAAGNIIGIGCFKKARSINREIIAIDNKIAQKLEERPAAIERVEEVEKTQELAKEKPKQRERPQRDRPPRDKAVGEVASIMRDNPEMREKIAAFAKELKGMRPASPENKAPGDGKNKTHTEALNSERTTTVKSGRK